MATFWRAVDAPTAAEWCTSAAASGEIVAVRIESADGGRGTMGYALPQWQRRTRHLPDPPARLRLLAPFDPVVWDRRRAQRLFGFDYRFEAFVPAAKRRHGYYVMPILEGDRFVGRLDPKPRGRVPQAQARAVWWEPGIRATRERRRALNEALGRLQTSFEAEE
jgi:uncharacterized protein YcaQ